MAVRTWTTTRCPHCNNIVGKHYKVGTSSHVNIGSPVAVCPFCNKPYRKTDINEWLFLSQKQRNEYLKFGDKGSDRFGMWAMIIVTSIMLIVAIACSFDDNFVPWILFGIFSVLTLLLYVIPHLLKLRNNKEKTYNIVILESIDRCLNIDYLRILKNSGFILIPLDNFEVQNNPSIKEKYYKIKKEWESINVDNLSVESEKNKVFIKP